MQNERDRRPIDPPPIVQLRITSTNTNAASTNYLQSPYIFMCVALEAADTESDRSSRPKGVLAGSLVSSLYRLRDVDNTEAGFFVFGDTSVRGEGSFRLKFCLFEITTSTSSCSRKVGAILHIKSVVSNVFTSFACKVFPGMQQTTFLSRTFSDQGVRLRIRKESRLQNDKIHPDQKPEQNRNDDYGAMDLCGNVTGTGSESRSMQDSLAMAYSMNEELSKLHVAHTPMATRPIGYMATRLYPYSFPAYSDSGTAGRFTDYRACHQGQISDPAPVLSIPNSLARDRPPGSLLANDLADRSASHHEGWQNRLQSTEQDYLAIQPFGNIDYQDMPFQIRGCSNYVSPATMLFPAQTASASERTMSVNDDLRLPPILFEEV